MSAVLAREVPSPAPARRGGDGPRLRVVRGGTAAARRATAPGGSAVVVATAGEPGLLLVPLGEVLVPAGRHPVLRLVPAEARPVPRSRKATRSGSETRPGTRSGSAPRSDGAATPGKRARPGASPGGRSAPASAASASPPVEGRARRPGGARGRVRALLLVLVVLLGLATARLLGAGAPVEAAAAPPAPQRLVVVQEGQTLWSLARELAPETDPRVVVEELRAANRLDGAGLAVGQRLLVPASR